MEKGGMAQCLWDPASPSAACSMPALLEEGDSLLSCSSF